MCASTAVLCLVHTGILYSNEERSMSKYKTCFSQQYRTQQENWSRLHFLFEKECVLHLLQCCDSRSSYVSVILILGFLWLVFSLQVDTLFCFIFVYICTYQYTGIPAVRKTFLQAVYISSHKSPFRCETRRCRTRQFSGRCQQPTAAALVMHTLLYYMYDFSNYQLPGCPRHTKGKHHGRPLQEQQHASTGVCWRCRWTERTVEFKENNNNLNTRYTIIPLYVLKYLVV